MSPEDLRSLAVIAFVAVVTVVIVERFPKARLNVVVLELLAGIVVGPDVLDIAHTTKIILSLSSLGLAFLMFTAGYELDFQRVKGRPIELAIIGWGISLGLGLGFGYALQSSGRVLDGLTTGLALTTTALGTLLPMWKDEGMLDSRFGSHALAIGTVGEFAPIVAIALLLGTDAPGKVTLLLLAFVVLALGATWVAMRPQSPRLVGILQKHLHTSSQLPVRVAVLLIVLLLWVASTLGLDVLLGAFTAGIIVRLASRGPTEETLRSKLEAIGFGFLIPIFFVVSGMGFDLTALEHDPIFILNIPLFLGLFLVVRGTPVLLYRRATAAGERMPLVLFSATALPLVVVITQIGVQSHNMRPQNASALVAAAMLSVVIFPTLAFSMLRRTDSGALAAPPLGGGAPLPEAEAEGSGEW